MGKNHIPYTGYGEKSHPVYEIWGKIASRKWDIHRLITKSFVQIVNERMWYKGYGLSYPVYKI